MLKTEDRSPQILKLICWVKWIKTRPTLQYNPKRYVFIFQFKAKQIYLLYKKFKDKKMKYKLIGNKH